jgi:hypothetical protein
MWANLRGPIEAHQTQAFAVVLSVGDKSKMRFDEEIQ